MRVARLIALDPEQKQALGQWARSSPMRVVERARIVLLASAVGISEAEKLEAIVGLYLNPPEHALVLCCDEKSQIWALDRTQPGLPLKRGRAAGTKTHDHRRNGTATLFAALNTLDGKVIGL